MAQIDALSKVSFSFAKSHSPLASSISWLTIKACWGLELSLGKGLKFSSHGTHGSSHILTFWPFPNTKQTPFFKTSLDFSIPHHIGDAC
jgi:hypothetical protein